MLPTFVNKPKAVLNKGSGLQNVHEDGWEIELLRIIGNARNITFDIVADRKFMEVIHADKSENLEKRKGKPYMFVRIPFGFSPLYDFFGHYTQSYYITQVDWYTPCAIKHERWSRFFNIFSVDMWICFALSLVLAVITFHCFSNYGHNPQLHESRSYTNIFNVTANVIAVLLSVSVSTQPRSAPLRLFFLSWVCYSVAISTVFQAYLTTFLIEPGYEEPIKTVEQMVKSKRMFGYPAEYKYMFQDRPDPINSAIFKNAVECHDVDTCFSWATEYKNISTILDSLTMDLYHGEKNMGDVNKGTILCKLENSALSTINCAILSRKESPFLEIVDTVLGHIIEGGISEHLYKWAIYKIKNKYDSHAFTDTYSAINIRHLQTAFYLLLLGYVLALACFVTEIMWFRFTT
jgi:hypothetical protein